MRIELAPPSLCGWIWQLDCVSLGHWPQGTTPGILSCWHRFSYKAMPTVLWSFTTGCTSKQGKAKSRECERVSLSVCAVLLQLDCNVQCCVCVSSRPVTCLMTVPVSACQRINLPDNSQLTAFSPPSLSFPIIPEYISEGNIFSIRTPCEVNYIFSFPPTHKLALKTHISWSETFAARPVSNACRRVAGSGICGKS